MLLHFALVLHFAAIVITFCVSITFCGDYYILRRNTVLCGFSGFLRIFADFNFLSQFFIKKDKFFIFIFCRKIYIFFFYFWVFLLKSAQKKLSKFSKILKVNVPESPFSFYCCTLSIGRSLISLFLRSIWLVALFSLFKELPSFLSH